MARITECSFASVVDVLRQVAPNSEDGGWEIAQLGHGGQAHVFAVRTRDGRLLWQTHRELVIKLYRANLPQENKATAAQFESLLHLYHQLNGRSFNDWNIACPFPLYMSRRPHALVMTMVPGKSITACLENSDSLSDQTLESMAQAVIGALEHYWSSGESIYGDLNFNNILCDLAGKNIALVDPGVLEDGFLCPGVSREWYPASRDLAHMLYEMGGAVKKNLGKPATRARQQFLMERILRAFVSKIESRDEQHRLLDEIGACVTVDLRSLQGSWLPRGLWRLLVRRIANQRINVVLDRLRADVGTRSVQMPAVVNR